MAEATTAIEDNYLKAIKSEDKRRIDIEREFFAQIKQKVITDKINMKRENKSIDKKRNGKVFLGIE